MGEYAKYRGEQIKMGTCEDLYYLRAAQAPLVTPERGSLNPCDRDTQQVIRFRFPWPDEDGTEPGAFDDYERSVPVPGEYPLPADLDHHTVQFSARSGYLVSLPCPEGPSSHGLTVHRNGFGGRVRIVQQGYRRGDLALICACGGCGARFNLPWVDAEPIVVACRAQADRAGAGFSSAWWHAVADRIAAGYGHGPAARDEEGAA